MAALDALHRKAMNNPTCQDSAACQGSAPKQVANVSGSATSSAWQAYAAGHPPASVLTNSPLQLAHDRPGGRGLVAATPAVAGDVLLSEAPLAMLATPSKDARNVRT